MPRRPVAWLLACVAVPLGLLPAPAEAGGVYNLHLATDNTPDYTDIDSLVHSATDAWTTPQDKCIAIWRLGRRSRRQTSCAVEGGRNIWDPVLAYNSYGAMNCGIISSLNIACFKQLGYKARYIQLGDHTVSEVSWDEGKTWHLFDSSMSVYCFNHEGVVASCEEIKSAAGCELSGGKVEPGHFYYYHAAPECASHLGPTGWRKASDQPVGYNRTLKEGADSYIDGFSVDKYCQVARTGHRYTLNLRPGDVYTRYWAPLGAAGAATDAGAAPDLPAGLTGRLKDLPAYRPMANGSDPDSQHDLHNLRGNGVWVCRPDLGAKDARALFYEDAGAAVRAETGAGAGPRVHPAAAGKPASVVFKVYAANVITGMRLTLAGKCAAPAAGDSGDRLAVSVSGDAGLHWETVWRATAAGAQAADIPLTERVAGVTQALVRVEMRAAKDPADVGIDSFEAVTLTQVNRRTLPALALGSNAVLLRADEQVDSAELWPALHNNEYKKSVAAEDSLSSADKPDGMYKATLGAAVNGKDCSATWKLAVPTDITGVDYAVVSTTRNAQSSVSLRHSWDGAAFAEFHRKASGEFPMDEQVHHAIAAKDVPAGAREAYLRGVFMCKAGGGTYNMPGVQDVLMRVSHEPRDPGFAPFEVTYCWTEHRAEGDVTRTHRELVTALPHKYAINVAGRRDPTMRWVRLNLRDGAADATKDAPPAKYGYSDGVDVGAKEERAKVAYRFEGLLSGGKPYTVSRESSAKSNNPDTGGGELTNGIVVAPTGYSTTKAVQPATGLWDAGEPVAVTVDLGKSAGVSGVRVSTHQPNANFCHPATVEVDVSEDGKTWARAGVIRHDDLFRPPGDYEAWEHDDDPKYAALPAGGRLAYSFPLAWDKPLAGRYVRFTCTPPPGKGMGLSEVEAFARCAVSAWPAEVALPPARP